MPSRFASTKIALATALIATALSTVPAVAADAPTAAPAALLYQRVTPSLVAVQFTFTGETVQQDVIVPGIVVNDQGLVMIPLAAVNEALPDEQLKKFKIIIPRQDVDNEEVDAEFQGRDERCQMAFVKAKPADGDRTRYVWTPLHFDSVPVQVGDLVSSVGMLAKSGGYHTFYTPAVVSANLRGPIKQVMVAGGGLGSPNAPVFNAQGQAIGLVLPVPPAELSLDDEIKNQQQASQRMISELATNRYFMPTAEFSIGLQSPPSVDHPVPMAWTGLPEQLLSGLTKNDAELFHLKNQPAVQINDMLSDSPAEKGGLKKKDIIIKLDGQPLERGDQPDELPAILHQKLVQHKPGDVVTFTVIGGKDEPPRDVKVTLEPQPMQANHAKRYWNEEIGFGVREMVILDRYGLKLKKNEKDGVLVTVLKEGGSAGSAGLHPYDMITQVNGQPVTDLSTFKSTYEDFRQSHAHDAIVLVVHRGGGDETIRIEPPQ